MTNPERREAYRRRARDLARNPEIHAKRLETMRRVHAELRPWVKAQAASMAPESRKKAGRTLSARRLAWCPPHLRDDYLHLINTKHVKAADARRMIEEMAAQEMARWRRSIGVAEEPTVRRIIEKPETDEALIAAVAAEFDVTLEDILGEHRGGSVLDARRTVIHILHEQGRTPGKIAKAVARADHKTIRFALDAYGRRATPFMREVAAMFLKAAR